MKQMLTLVMSFILAISLCSCSLLATIAPEHEDEINEAETKLQDMFGDGLKTLQNLINKSIIEAQGSTTDEAPGSITAYDDKIVLHISPAKLIERMDKEGITADSILKERENANIAQMEYILEYQYAIELKVNGGPVCAVCTAPANESALAKTIEIVIPLAKEDISTTLYDLLQGGSMTVESCLRHGTEHSQSCKETYTISTSSNNAQNVLTFTDKRAK